MENSSMHHAYTYNRNASLILITAIIAIIGIIVSYFFLLNIFMTMFVAIVIFTFYLVLVIVLLSTGNVTIRIKNKTMSIKTDVSDIKQDVSGTYNFLEKKFIGNSDKKIYHENSCRMVKKIRNDLILSSDDIKFFRNKRYKPCKICLKK